MLAARSRISKSETLGLEMVSIMATVSPKSLLICGRTGWPATVGRSVIDSSAALQVLPHLLGILDAIEQLDEHHREILPAQRTDLFHVAALATCFSIFRVTSCSTFSASAPG